MPLHLVPVGHVTTVASIRGVPSFFFFFRPAHDAADMPPIMQGDGTDDVDGWSAVATSASQALEWFGTVNPRHPPFRTGPLDKARVLVTEALELHASVKRSGGTASQPGVHACAKAFTSWLDAASVVVSWLDRNMSQPTSHMDLDEQRQVLASRQTQLAQVRVQAIATYRLASPHLGSR